MRLILLGTVLTAVLGRQKRDHADIGDTVLEIRKDAHRDRLDGKNAIGVDRLHLQHAVGQLQNPLGA